GRRQGPTGAPRADVTPGRRADPRAMLIVCPACTAAYRIELSTLGAAGRTVRCARCRATWFASVADLASAALALPSGQGTDPPAPATDERREGEQEHEAGGTADAAADPTSITIDNAPSLVPALAHENGTAGGSGADIETLAARRERQGAGKNKRRRRARPGLPTIILVLAAVLAALVNWRATVVSFVPQTAGLFASIGLPVNL